jgi:hypothetical protein
MKYLEVAEAKDLPGLRLVLTAFVPGPWGESAKKILEYKQIPYAPVAQYAGKANEALVAWTGIRNAPNAMYDDEPPRTGWYDILMLAERLAPERPLLPTGSEDRALVLGISSEICSEWGWGWARRAMMGTPFAGTPDPARVSALSKPPWGPEDSARMRTSYSASVGGPAEAPTFCACSPHGFTARRPQVRPISSGIRSPPAISIGRCFPWPSSRCRTRSIPCPTGCA